MESVRQLPDDGGQTHIQLLPGKVDVVLGAHPTRRKPGRKGKSSYYGWMLVGLMPLAFCAYLLISATRPAVPKPANQTAELPVVPVDQLSPQISSAPTPQPLPDAASDLSLPATNSQTSANNAKPLDACMKNGNVIDENVLNCRFGQVPRPSEREPAKGMVSSSYMANFKSDIARSGSEKPVKTYSTASVNFRAVDSRSRYTAHFKIFNNRIDNASVCMNFSKGSAENRECRRAAVIFFKEACQDWSKRAARDRDEQTKLTQERYCEANSTFEAG
jgi:hypothetical protein